MALSMRLRSFFLSPIDGPTFARLIAYFSGFLAGVAVVQLDDPVGFQGGRASEVALATTVLVAIFVALHALGHVSPKREKVAQASALTAVAAVAGAIVGWLPDILVLIFVAALVAATFWAAQQAHNGKLGTVWMTATMGIAEISCLVGLSLESAVVRSALVHLTSVMRAMIH